MGNCGGRLIGGGYEETIALDVHVVSTPNQTPGLHVIALEECASSVDEVALGDRGWVRSLGDQKTEYTSVSAEAMVQSKSEFSSDADHVIEHAKAQWSILRDVDQNVDEENVYLENLQYFSDLQNDPRWINPSGNREGPFFGNFEPSAMVGRRIAEGGQAEIFERLDANGNVSDNLLFKVFKNRSQVSHLRLQWPSAVLEGKVIQVVKKGVLLEDGRFAFVMLKCWGDLRKLIDQAMQAKNNQGPPFPFEWNGVTLHALHIMKGIAFQMRLLHKEGIVHRDLKASNILLSKKVSYPHVVVADFECSIGVVGTGFWRAPEILLGLKNGGPIDYSEKVDVYGYAMTCYEIVTGLLPFGGELGVASNDQVIGGRRPKLPSDLDVALKGLIERCWDPNPLERPTFSEIFGILMYISRKRAFYNCCS